VRDLLAHLVSVLDSSLGLKLRATVAERGLPSKVTAALARSDGDRTPDELVATYRRHVDSHFAPPGLGRRSSRTDVMVRRTDAAVPLGLDVDRPVGAWRPRPVLDLLTS
jgi:hypothetical protein